MMLLQEAPVKDRLMSVDEFEHLLALPENQDRLLELIHGKIVEKTPTEEHGVVAVNLVTSLSVFVRRDKLGRVGVEVRQRLPQDTLNFAHAGYLFQQRPATLSHTRWCAGNAGSGGRDQITGRYSERIA
jgi:hypothetical protein